MSSSIVLPSRGKCIQISDNIQCCRCQWFFPPDSLLLDQNICGHCGHGIHAHADYVSTVVNHYPANQCAAYAQMTHLTQRCTCEAQFCEHTATDNWYRLLEPWTVLDYFNPSINGPSPSVTSSSYSNCANGPFSPNIVSFSSNHNPTIFPSDPRNIPLTPPPIYSSYSCTSAIQPHTTQTPGGNSSGSYFAQYSDHIVNLPYARQPEGNMTNGSFECCGYPNVMYAECPARWSGPYGA